MQPPEWVKQFSAFLATSGFSEDPHSRGLAKELATRLVPLGTPVWSDDAPEVCLYWEVRMKGHPRLPVWVRLSGLDSNVRGLMTGLRFEVVRDGQRSVFEARGYLPLQTIANEIVLQVVGVPEEPNRFNRTLSYLDEDEPVLERA